MLQRRRFIAALLTMPIISRWCAADSTRHPDAAFAPGEKLRYQLGWQFITAGFATLEVLPDECLEGKKVRSFSLTARTRKIVDHIFKVRDTVSSLAEYDLSRSLGYNQIQREGKTKRDISVDFDWDNMNAHYFEALKKKSKITPVVENTLDPLSAFYFVRNQHLEVGSVIEGPMTDGKKCKIAQIRVVKREKIKAGGKKYDTFKLVPDIQDLGGVFESSKDASMALWCTTDWRHLPVLMESKVAVGSFKAELIEAITPSDPIARSASKPAEAANAD